MQNSKDRIKQREDWKKTLAYFEAIFGKVDIDKINGYYTIYPKGKRHEYDNLLTTLDMTSLESVVTFMQGANTSAMIKRKFEDIPPQKTLMEMLLEAGYPKEEMFHHCSDLYIYVTPLTEQIVKQWCAEREFSVSWHCPTFKDQITGRTMYDCAFQYYRMEE